MRAFLIPNKRKGTRLGATYSIPVDSIGAEELEDEKRTLTLQAKSNFGPPARPFEVYRIHDGRFEVPRFYGLQRFGAAEEDHRVDGESVCISFNGALRDVQSKAMGALFSNPFTSEGDGGAITVLPCGFGKTVLAVAVASRIGRKVAVMVHTAVLKTQWKNAFETFCSGVRVGYVQGQTMDVEEKDVVIMMIQTVAKRQFEFHVTDQFGMVICDEAHHMAAPIMSQALLCFRARYVLALTATKERIDGLTRLLHWSLGPEVFRAERKTHGARVTVFRYEGAATHRVTKDGRFLVAVMLNHLGIHPGRNSFIAHRAAAMHRAGRVIIVLSHRCAQLKHLKSLLEAPPHELPGERIGLLESSQKEDQREAQMGRPILLCSYNMADEGLDKKTLDTLIMATPKSRVEQCIGRILRECETKQSPLVMDIADDGAYFERLGFSRMAYYRKNKYETQVIDLKATDSAEWFA